MRLSSSPRWRRILVAVAVAMTAGGLTCGPVTAGAVSTPTLTWSTLSPPLSPPPLAYASMAYDNDNATVVLFGGQRADGTLSSDTWVWNGSTWSRSPSAVPARKLAAMAFDPVLHQLILFGGQGGGNQLLNDTWAWNGASWVVQTPDTGTSPPAREGASLGFDTSDQLLLFGGSGAAGATPSAASGAGAPSGSAPRSAAPAGSTSGPATAILADANPLMTLGDTWVWTGSTWSEQTVGGPVARTDAAMTWDSAHHQTVLFGGSSSPVGAVPPRGMLADTWIWGSGAWAPTAPPISPLPRQDTTVSADSDLGGLVAFGGSTPSGPSNDTWVWNGQAWAQLSPTASPTPRQGAAAAYDSSAHQLVLFGGLAGGGAVLGDTEILAAKAPAMPGPSSAAGTGSQLAPGSTTGPSTTAATGRSGPTNGSHPQPSAPDTGLTPSQQKNNARQVRHGDLVTLSGSGFKANAPVTITFHSTPYLVGRTVADAAGSFFATVAVPSAATPGLHHFEATGMGESGVMITLVTPVDVVETVAHHRALAETLVLVVVAIALPVGTWLAMGIGWRRRDVPAGA
ncbi:MAG: hypothetical protein M3Y91_10520 [Actinomycetota bacterium]|nr:hypothetical protein [Actinomycetota bacterium]